MKRLSYGPLLLLGFLIPVVAAQIPRSPAGVWSGNIELPNTNLSMAVTLNTAVDGSWTGSIDIPAQNLRGASLSSIAVQGQSVTFHIANLPGDPTFKGTLGNDSNSLSGTMTQGAASFGFQLARGNNTPVAVTKVTGDAGPLTGQWQGTLGGGGQTLHLTLRITRLSGDAGFVAELDSQEQNAKSLPVDTLDVEGSKVRFHLRVGADFEGTLNADKSRITGTWSQGAGSAPLVFQKGAGNQARTQDPRPPFPYQSEDVTIRNERAGIRLSGTVTAPRSGGPFPAVVLISGSGPQDRDETILQHKPFLVLADHLTRSGIVVLRVDDRGVGGSDRGTQEPTSEDLAGDVRAEVDYLKSRSDVAKARIGLIGHSEGGIIAPMLASKSNDIAFIVLMAGSGVKGEDLLYLQGAAILKAQGGSEDLIQWNRSVQQRIFGQIKSESSSGVEDAAARRKLTEEILPEYMSRLGMRDEATARNAIDVQMRSLSSAWFRFFLKYDPAPALAAVHCPVLALIGENDVQVPYKENLPAIKTALERGGNRDAAAMSLPKLNHLFQTSVTGSVTEYETIDETIAPSALELISSWILRHTR